MASDDVLRCRSCWTILWVVAIAVLPARGAPFVPTRNAHCVAYSPDGTLVAIGYSGQSNNEFPPGPHPNPRKCAVVQWFDAATARRLQRKETFGDLTRVGFSQDGRLLAACRLYASSDGVPLNQVTIWEVRDGTVWLSLDRCHSFCFSPTDDKVFVASRTNCVSYELTSGSKNTRFESLSGALALEVSPDGGRLAAIVSASGEYAIRVCDTDSGQLVGESAPFKQPFYAAVFSPSGRQIASGHAPGRIILWDVDTLLPITRFQTGGRGNLHPFFSSNGNTLGAGDQLNGDVVFWDLASGGRRHKYTFEEGSIHTHYVRRSEDEATPEKAPHRFVFTPHKDSFLAGPHGGIVRLLATGQDVQHFGQ
jgi:WD40 repeat protein